MKMDVNFPHKQLALFDAKRFSNPQLTLFDVAPFCTSLPPTKRKRRKRPASLPARMNSPVIREVEVSLLG